MDTHEQGREEISDVVPQKPIEIIGLTSDRNGNIIGLGNNGKLYYYTSVGKEWVLH
jgi:hypothetical protein